MPADNPQYGEMWSLNDAGNREVLAIVSDTSLNMYTLISLTGQRMRFPIGGRYRWTYVRDLRPATGLLCERHGCSNTGFLRYTAPIGFGYACPRHIPMGLEYQIQEDWIPNQTNWRATVHAHPCPNPDCPNNDPIEDPSQLPQGIETLNRFWSCTLCARQWMDTISDNSVLVGRPAAQIAGAHAHTTIGMLAALRSARHEPERIQFSPSTWRAMDAAAYFNTQDQGTPLFDGVPCQINPTTPNTVILLSRNIRRNVQRLGGQPNRTTARTPRSVQEQLKRGLSVAEELTPILDGTYWAQRKVGDLIQVVRTEQIANTRKTETMVIIKQLRNTDSPTVPLTRKDFLRLYTPHTEREPEIVVLPRIAVGEEWVSTAQDQDITIEIVDVDVRDEMVIGHLTKDDGSIHSLRIPFEQFLKSARRWRKFTRRSAYERLWEEDL